VSHQRRSDKSHQIHSVSNTSLLHYNLIPSLLVLTHRVTDVSIMAAQGETRQSQELHTSPFDDKVQAPSGSSKGRNDASQAPWRDSQAWAGEYQWTSINRHMPDNTWIPEETSVTGRNPPTMTFAPPILSNTTPGSMLGPLSHRVSDSLPTYMTQEHPQESAVVLFSPTRREPTVASFDYTSEHSVISPHSVSRLGLHPEILPADRYGKIIRVGGELVSPQYYVKNVGIKSQWDGLPLPETYQEFIIHEPGSVKTRIVLGKPIIDLIVSQHAMNMAFR
jgi:hypothetical protein